MRDTLFVTKIINCPQIDLREPNRFGGEGIALRARYRRPLEGGTFWDLAPEPSAFDPAARLGQA